MRQSDNSQSPLVADGRVFVFAYGQTNCVLAFNSTNGNLLWKGHNYTPTYASPLMATFSGVRQLLFQVHGRLLALNPEDGCLLWTQTNSGDYTTPVPWGESLIAPEQSRGVLNVFMTNGTWGVTNAWTSPEFCTMWTLPVVRDGYIYDIINSNFSDGGLRCVRMADGKVQWSTNGFGAGSVILAGNRLIVVAESGWLQVVNATQQGYQVLARCRPLTNGCFNLPAVADGHIYVRNFDKLACLDARPLLVGKFLPQPGGGLSLTFNAQDESPVDAARVQRVQLQMANTLGTNAGNWVPFTSPRIYSNGAVIFTDLPSPPRFFRVYETNAP
jgi:outer membrane protein assembly factor BamB